MTPILPIYTTDLDRIDMLVGLAVVLPAQQAIEAVGSLRAVFQMVQDYVWETAITSVEGVLALGAFNLLVSFLLALWVASAVRRGHVVAGVTILKAAASRYRVFGAPACAAAPTKD